MLKLAIDTSKTTTTTGKYGNKNLDNMGRHVIVDTTTTTTTTTGKYGNKNLDNMGRHVIVDTSKTTTTTGKYGAGKSGYGESSSSGYGNGNMSRKVIVETTTTTTTKGGKSGSGFSIEKVTSSKSGNQNEWGSSGSSITLKGASKGGASSKVTVTGGKKPWALEVSNGDFTGRNPSDAEASAGGNGYTKYSSKKEVKYQPTKGGATSTVTKFSVKRTGNVITKGY